MRWLLLLGLLLAPFSGCVAPDGCVAVAAGSDGRSGDGRLPDNAGYIRLCGTTFRFLPTLGGFEVNATDGEMAWDDLTLQGPPLWHVAIGRAATAADPLVSSPVDLGDVAEGDVKTGDRIRFCGPSAAEPFTITLSGPTGARSSSGFVGQPPSC